MPKILRRCSVFLLAIVILSCLWIFRPYESYNDDKIIPQLSSLKEPFSLVDSAYYMDGGTVGIKIIDAEGTEALFCLPALPAGSKEKEYQRLFVGCLHLGNKDERTLEISDSKDSILRLGEILREEKSIDHGRDIAIASISGRWKDFTRIIIRKLVTRDY